MFNSNKNKGRWNDKTKKFVFLRRKKKTEKKKEISEEKEKRGKKVIQIFLLNFLTLIL